MAFVFGVVFNNLLCQRNVLHKQIINNIKKISTATANKQFRDQSNEFIETLSHLLDTNDLSQDLCGRVRNEIINKHHISEQTVDTRVLDACGKENKYEFAKAYVNYLRNNGCSLNIFALGAYLQIYYTNFPTSISEENDIINICEKIKEECECIPIGIKNNCIIALSKTYQWKKALELFEGNICNKNNSEIISNVITAAFRNGDMRLGLKLLDEMYDPHMHGHRFSGIYNEYLDYYMQQKPEELEAAIKKIFDFWMKYDIIPTKYIIDILVNACNKRRWETTFVTIKRNGYCSHCNNQLTEKSVDEEAFQILAKEIASKVLVSSDIFHNSTPMELKRFKSFIYRTKPYDIVIDGLNVSSGYRNVEWLKAIVEWFSEQEKKVLVITRKHMYANTKWILQVKNASAFFFENVTKDDPYILYATFKSGINAQFMSYDLLRQHLHKLENLEIRRIFKRWQYTHQYGWSFNNRHYTVMKPWVFEPYVQYTNGYWHIPYRQNSEKNKLLARPVDTWLCLRFPKK